MPSRRNFQHDSTHENDDGPMLGEARILARIMFAKHAFFRCGDPCYIAARPSDRTRNP